jgi:tetratricopeptide (TPR) repeat protein
MEILLTIALFIAFFLLLRQEKSLGKYAQSTTLFTRSVHQYKEAIQGYQKAIEGYRKAIAEYQEAIEQYELLLKEHDIEKSRTKAEPARKLIPPPPPQFNHRQTELSQLAPKDMTLSDLKTTKREPTKPKGVSKNNPLYREFLTLLSGNEETANRLITRQQQLNPDRSETWILEKVVGDIKRDRRA